MTLRESAVEIPANRYAAAIGVSFHFVLRPRAEVDRVCIAPYRFVPLHA